VLEPVVMRDVELRHHNLLDPPPSPRVQTEWDVILCRNVLIYLTDNAARSVLLRLGSMLSEDGYLLLGSSEHAIGERAPFRATQSGPAFVYRPEATDPGESLTFEAHRGPPTMEGPSLEEETLDFTDQGAVRKLLEAGVAHTDARAAVACYEAAAGYSPFASETYVLLAAVLEGEGARQRAIDALGKVLFLDPHNWWAAAERGRLYEDRGDRVEARRHWRMVLDGLDQSDRNPFDPALVVGTLATVATRRDETRRRAVRALQRLTGDGM
jgi:chemotaxis protein methyltransferase CheR